jgi:hypothetical protein
MKKLYQKHHGLTGCPQFEGTPGVDGNNGNNVYFGFVSEFFSHRSMDIDNFIRVAQKNSSVGDYYTGIFRKKSDSSFVDQKNYVENSDINSSILNNTSYNIFNQINTKNYDYSYINEDTISRIYAKVDYNNTGLDASRNKSVWNNSTKNENPNKYNFWIQNSSFPWPYDDKVGTTEETASDNKLTQTLGSIESYNDYSPFSIINNGKKYYISPKEKYNDIRFSNYNDYISSWTDLLKSPYSSSTFIDYLSDLYYNETGVSSPQEITVL